MTKFGFLSVLALLAFSGCQSTVDVSEGRVPADLLESARTWIGTYAGAFDDEEANVSLALDDDRAILTASRDLVGKDCQSKIGELKTISYDKGDRGETVGKLTFALDVGHCLMEVEGRTIDVRAQIDGGKIVAVDVSFLNHTEWRHDCSIIGQPPHSDCHDVPFSVYSHGRLGRGSAGK